MKKRAVIGFFDLSEEWQVEARENLGEDAEEQMYLEPLKSHSPKKHILWDLSECYPVAGEKYNAVIPVSNNSCLRLKFDPYYEYAEIIKG